VIKDLEQNLLESISYENIFCFPHELPSPNRVLATKVNSAVNVYLAWISRHTDHHFYHPHRFSSEEDDFSLENSPPFVDVQLLVAQYRNRSWNLQRPRSGSGNYYQIDQLISEMIAKGNYPAPQNDLLKEPFGVYQFRTLQMYAHRSPRSHVYYCYSNRAKGVNGMALSVGKPKFDSVTLRLVKAGGIPEIQQKTSQYANTIILPR